MVWVIGRVVVRILLVILLVVLVEELGWLLERLGDWWLRRLVFGG